MASETQYLIIESSRAERRYWRDLWRYRELFHFLAWPDILLRYKQTVVGAVWSLIRPFLTMVVLTVVFGKFAKMPLGGVPYLPYTHQKALPPGLRLSNGNLNLI